MEHKHCSRCHTTKPVAEFYRDRSTKDGLCFYCKPCKNVKVTDYVSRNREKTATRIKAWVDARPGYAADVSRRWRAANPEKARQQLNASAKRWQARNREYVLEYKRRKYRSNLELSRAQKREYERKRRAAGDRYLTMAEESAVLEKTGGLCNYCDAPWEAIDHFYPLAKGGSHDADNLVPACKSCNSSKHATDPWVWMFDNDVVPKIIPCQG